MVTVKQAFVCSYAHLPAALEGDQTLPLTVRLLYGEIAGLCHQTGFCWATNAYFASRCRVTKRTIGRWLSLLQRKGYIQLQQDKTRGNRRQIFVINAQLPPAYAPPAHTLSLASTATTGIDAADIGYGQMSAATGRDTLYNMNYTMNKVRGMCTPVPNEKITLFPILPAVYPISKKQLQPDRSLPFPPVAAGPPSRKPKATALGPPSPEEIRTYLREKAGHWPESEREHLAERFYNYYQANGWRVGKNPMKDWQAAARNWMLNQKDHGHYQQSHPADRRHPSRDQDYHEPL